MKKIALAGYGVEGKSSLAYWRTLGAKVTVYNETPLSESLPEGVEVVIGQDVFTNMEGFDIVMRSPSIAPRRIHTDGKVWSATNEFFAQCPAPIIGITASKGKGTISSFIAHILQASGKTVHLVGNIGVPALDSLGIITPDDVVVFELSSFQLWDLERGPSIGIVGHIEPDHLDVHADFSEYIFAKGQISRTMADNAVCFYHPGNLLSKQIASQGNAAFLPYIDDASVHIRDTFFYLGEQKICSTDAVRLPGRHNLENACAAISACLRYAGSNFSDIENGLKSFGGLPHRLKYVDEINQVRFFDDSIATTPGSTIAAMDSFGDASKALILGGSSKGVDFSELIHKLTQRQDIAFVALIGDEAHRIAALLDQAENAPSYTIFPDLSPTIFDNILPIILEKMRAGGVVILSPACASFGMFENYADRGNRFIEAVRELKDTRGEQ